MTLNARYAALVADRRAEATTDPEPVSEGQLADTILRRWDVLTREAQARYPKPSR